MGWSGGNLQGETDGWRRADRRSEVSDMEKRSWMHIFMPCSGLNASGQQRWGNFYGGVQYGNE